MSPNSYAMFWRVGDGPRHVGRIEVDGEAISLSATTPSALVETVRFRELVRVLLDRSMLHLERSAGAPVHIGSLDAPGALRELADRVSDAARA